MHNANRWRATCAAIATALVAAVTGTPTPALAVGSSCQTSNPAGPTYTVRVCLTVGEGTTVTGDAPVTATATITGSSPGLRKLEFTIDGEYLLTDFESPYSFFIPTPRFVDGPHSIVATALLRDGRSASSPAVTMTFANGVTTPPPPTTGFQPTAGRTPADGEPYVVAITGDGASGQKSSDSVVDLIDSWNPSLFLYTGDVYEKGTATEFDNWYGRDGVRFGTFKSISNPIVGNHEYENGGAPGYFDYWSGVPDYYSYDAGGWHFIALNSNTQLYEFDPGTDQYEWLKADLAANPGGCTLAYFHHPVLSVGPQGDTPNMFPMWKLMADNGVDIVVAGHDHQYQRWVPLDGNFDPAADGITNFVAGGGGHGIQSTVRMDSRVAAVADTTTDGFGSMRLELAGGSAQYSYVSIDGVTRDSGTVTCTGTPADHLAPSVPSGVTATSPDSPEVTVAWTASTDNRGVGAYEIRRDADTVATVPATDRSWVDRSTAPLTAYEYSVRATDLSGNHSDWSAPVSVTTADVKSSFRFTAAADAYVSASQPTTNYGTRPELRLDTSPVQQTLLRFEAAGLGVRTPTTEVLRVRPASSLSAGFEVRRVDGAWTEGSVTYESAPPLGEVLAVSGPVAAGEWVDIPIRGVVTGDGTYDLALAPLSSTALRLDSREAGAPAELLAGFADTGDPLAADAVQVDLDEDGSSSWVPAISGGDGSPVACAVSTQPQHGTATVEPDCSAGTYVPAPDYAGPDSFGYAVTDDAGHATADVAVDVRPTNDAPGAQPASATAWAGTTVAVELAATDIDGDCPLAFEVLTGPSHGALGAPGDPVCADGTARASVDYSAPADWTGTDTIAFRVTDPGGAAADGTAEIVVTALPETVAVPAAADAFVDASNPTRTYGARSDLRIDASPEQTALVRFDLGGVAPLATGLTLRVRAGSSLSAGFEVHASAGGWSEGSVTAATAPPIGELVAASGPATAGTWVEIPLPASAIAPDGTVAVALTALSTTALRLDSRESANPPELVVATG